MYIHVYGYDANNTLDSGPVCKYWVEVKVQLNLLQSTEFDVEKRLILINDASKTITDH